MTAKNDAAYAERKLYKKEYDGFSRQKDGKKACVLLKNCRVENGAVTAAFALERAKADGQGVIGQMSGTDAVCFAKPSLTRSGVRYEDVYAVGKNGVLYRYLPTTHEWSKTYEYTYTSVPRAVSYFEYTNEECALLFGEKVVRIRNTGNVEEIASVCFKNYGCAAFERVFFAKDEKTLAYSGVQREKDYTESADEGGYIAFPVVGGMRGIVDFKGRVYVFFEGDAYRIDARGAARDFSCERLAYGGGEIVDGSVFNCGNAIVFATDTGIWTYDGNDFERVGFCGAERLFMQPYAKYFAGANGKYAFEIFDAADARKSSVGIVYDTVSGTFVETDADLSRVCAYGNELFVSVGGKIMRLCEKGEETGREYIVETTSEDFSKSGLKTLRKIKLYGSGVARVSVLGKDEEGKTTGNAVASTVRLTEGGTAVCVNLTANSFIIKAYLDVNTVLRAHDAEYSAFDRGR